MVDASYNKFSAIAIGGTYVNNIPTIYGNVSLDVSGHAAIRGNLYVTGTANIDVSGGGFSGTDLSLNGNIYLGGAIIPRNAKYEFDVSASNFTLDASNLIVDVSDVLALYSRNDMVLQTKGAGSVYIQPQGSGNVVFGTVSGDVAMDAYGSGTFQTRTGDLNFATDAGNMNFDTGTTKKMYFRTSGVGGTIYMEARDDFDIRSNYGPLNINTINGGDITIQPANNRQLYLNSGTGLGDINMFSYENITIDASASLGLKGKTAINFDNQIYFNRTPVSSEYTTNNKALGYTNSINAGTTYTGTASDTLTPAQVGTFTLPSKGVWLIQFDCQLVLNTGSDTITNKIIVLSDTTASATPCAAGFYYYEPIDDAAGAASDRQAFSFSGIYHYTETSTAPKYINVTAQTSGTRTVTASGSYKYTKIG